MENQAKFNFLNSLFGIKNLTRIRDILCNNIHRIFPQERALIRKMSTNFQNIF